MMTLDEEKRISEVESLVKSLVERIDRLEKSGDPVERLAKILHDVSTKHYKDRKDICGLPGWTGFPKWDEMWDDTKECYRAMAKAVLTYQETR